MPKPKRTFLSLFSGCGGLDSGFHASGFCCIGAFDSDSLAVATYNQNFGNAQATALDLRKWQSLSTGLKPDVILAGPPCQGFSPIGEFDSRDPRNTLLLVPIVLGIRLLTPLIVIENVPGVAMNRHSSIWRRAQHLLFRSGYHVRVAIVNAADFGIPQLRRRVILTASLTPTRALTFQAGPKATIGSVLNLKHPHDRARRPLRSPDGLPPPPIPDRASPSRHSSCENSLAIKCPRKPWGAGLVTMYPISGSLSSLITRLPPLASSSVVVRNGSALVRLFSSMWRSTMPWLFCSIHRASLTPAMTPIVLGSNTERLCSCCSLALFFLPISSLVSGYS